MGLFSFFRREARPSLEQLSYNVAYQVLPGYAHGEIAALTDKLRDAPAAANALFYQLACKAAKVKPDAAEAAQFQWHAIPAFGARTFLVLAYPTPAPLDMSGMSFVEVRESAGTWVLAPYFSAIVKDGVSGKAHYFVLGQTPKGGGTAMRRIDADLNNVSLGPGPAPTLGDFVGEVKRLLDGPAS